MSTESIHDFEKSMEYWAEIPPTVNGVLGGFGFISETDIEGSALFLKSLFLLSNPPAKNKALDCGAGIGRVSRELLLPNFDSVDLIEPDEKFVERIREFVGVIGRKIEDVYEIGLQEFVPVKKYDVIWNQWVLGYLSDKDLISFLIRCRDALTDNGIIVVKENVTSSGELEKDYADYSVTRTYKQYISIFKKCNLKRIKQSKQANFPQAIYPVYIFALVPKDRHTQQDPPSETSE